MEDYIPFLREFGKKLLKMDLETLDGQEMDYICEINEYTGYVIGFDAGADVKPPSLLFLGRD